MKQMKTIRKLFLILLFAIPAISFAGGSLDLVAEAEEEALKVQLQLQILQLQLQIAQILEARGETIDDLPQGETTESGTVEQDEIFIAIQAGADEEEDSSIDLTERSDTVTFSIRTGSIPGSVAAGETITVEWFATGFSFSDLITIEAYAGDNQHFFGSFLPSNGEADLTIPNEFAGEAQVTFIAKYNGQVIDSEATLIATE